MDYAIIKLGGKQYRVREGEYIVVDRVKFDEGATFEPDVLLGDSGVKVTATVLEHGRGPKIRIGKYKKRTGYKRHNGFRAATSRVEFSLGGASKRAAAKKTETAAPKTAEEAAPKAAAPKEVAPHAAAPKTEAAAPAKAAADDHIKGMPSGYEAMTVAQSYDLTSFVTAQDEYSLLERKLEKDRLPIMRKHDMALLPYFPLASGLLTGKYKHNAPLPAGTRLARNPPRHADEFLNERNWRIVDALDAFVARRGHTLLELAMSWLASRPYIPSIIAGATRPEQVGQNIAAVGWALSAADLAEIDRITL